MTHLEWYAIVVVHLGLIPAVLYPWYYRRSPWRSTEVGRALMTKGVAVASLFVVSVVGFWWPFPGYMLVYDVMITGVVAAITYQFAVMRRLQQRGRVNSRGQF